MSDQAKAGPSKIWRLGRWRFGRYERYDAWRWEVSDGSLGSSGHTAIGALVRLLKWRREYRNAPPGRWAE